MQDSAHPTNHTTTQTSTNAQLAPVTQFSTAKLSNAKAMQLILLVWHRTFVQFKRLTIMMRPRNVIRVLWEGLSLTWRQKRVRRVRRINPVTMLAQKRVRLVPKKSLFIIQLHKSARPVQSQLPTTIQDWKSAKGAHKISLCSIRLFIPVQHVQPPLHFTMLNQTLANDVHWALRCSLTTGAKNVLIPNLCTMWPKNSAWNVQKANLFTTPKTEHAFDALILLQNTI
jgi:hypothetical protein